MVSEVVRKGGMKFDAGNTVVWYKNNRMDVNLFTNQYITIAITNE